VRIREILRNYPEGLSILKELIQNADDAGARTVRFCAAAPRPRSSADVDQSPLSQLMEGPSLLAYNSASFTDTDFKVGAKKLVRIAFPSFVSASLTLCLFS
jgi:sacsin